MKSANPPLNLPGLSLLPIIGVILLLLWGLISQCLVVVPAGNRAVIFNTLKGLDLTPRQEGLHILVPVVENPIFYDVRSQTYTMSSQRTEGLIQGDDALRVLSADGQQIVLDVSVRFRINPDEVAQLHQAIGPNYLDKVVRPEVRTVVRNELALHRAISIFSDEREQVQQNIQDQLTEKFGESHLALQDVFLRNVRFSDQFQTAIEQKQIAEQEKERERFLVEKAELEKQRAITQAEGDSTAIQLKGEALRQAPAVVQLEYVQKIAPGARAIITNPRDLGNLQGSR